MDDRLAELEALEKAIQEGI
ncbi:hypothetical protein A2U01_0063639, partial [Trifolium medium]|nr:hypothetical protein [Trifolium medium]